MQPATKITFSIPFYKGAGFLERALRSILAQRDPRWEAIVCDDGPEPGIDALVASLGDARIRYVRNATNIGMSANFNQCLERAETELVTIVHNDDELMPTYCETMLGAAERYPHAAALFCRVMIIDAHGRPIWSVPDLVKDYLFNPSRTEDIVVAGEPGIYALLKGNFISCPTLCFRKPILAARRFADYKFVLDWDLTTQLLLDGDTLVGVPQRCYRYRRHEAAATSQYTRNQLRFREESDYYDRMTVECSRRGWERCARLARAKPITKLNLAYQALRDIAGGNFTSARRGVRLLREL